MSPDTGLILVLNKIMFSFLYSALGWSAPIRPKKMKSIFPRSMLCCAILITTQSVQAQDTDNTQQHADSLEKITIISSKIPIPLREIATSVSVIDQQQIAARGYVSLADIMRHEVSVGVSNSGGVGKNTTLRIRGEDGFRTKVYMDGVELSDPTAPQATPIFDDILSGFVQRIEILRGPQGLMYGADAGGVISITSKHADAGVHSAVKTELGRYSTKLLNGQVGLANQDGHLHLALGDFETAGFNAQTSDSSDEKDGYKNTTLHLNTGYNFSDSLQLNFVLRDVKSENEYDGCFDNKTFELINQCRTDGKNQTARVSLEYSQAKMSHSLAYAKTSVERQFYSNEEFSFGSEGKIAKLDYSASYEQNQQRFVWGVDNEIHEITNTQLERQQTGLYVEYQTSMQDRIFFTTGLRYDDNDTFGTHTSYRVSAAYLVPLVKQQLLKFKSTFGTGFRAPSLFEQDYNDGAFAFGEAADLQLNEETSKGFDIGVDFSNAERQVSVVFFKQSIANEIYFDGLAFQGYLQNVLSSDSVGAELEFSQRLSQHLKIWSNYTYNETKTSADEKRLRRPKHQANIGLQSAFLSEKLKINISVKSVKDLVDIGARPLDNYTISNLSADYQINTNFKLNLRIENMFDKEYQDVAGFNSAGQAWHIGLTWQL
jgi:vitamin B12 transporter